MNKKLRLVVTDKCHNKCPLCCNNRFDLSQLPVVERWDYEEIMITGGEPLLFVERAIDLVRDIKTIQKIMGIEQSTQRDVEVFSRLIPEISHNLVSECSMRINLFADVRKMLDNVDVDLSGWKVKQMEWIKDCPVPVGEDLRRINNLFI